VEVVVLQEQVETVVQVVEALTEEDLEVLEQLIKDLQEEMELENLHTTVVVEEVLLQQVLIVTQATVALVVLG
tara:strand:+ start:318 stop:536 length:219 start_codon:yes stop_codon:yes gene_type:complete